MMNPRSLISRWFRGWPRGEFGVFAVLFVVAAALFAFGALWDEMSEGETRHFDAAILLAFRHPDNLAQPIGPPWLPGMVRDITSLGSTAVLTLLTIAVVGYLLMDGKRATALLVVAAVGGGAVVSNLLKFGIERPRPELVSHLVDVRSSSFPSGHAMVSAVTYLTLGALLARVQPRRRIKAYLLSIAVGTTLLVGMSRVYLGVHWPTDVLAGWCAGAAWAMTCWLIELWLQRRGGLEPDAAQGDADSLS